VYTAIWYAEAKSISRLPHPQSRGVYTYVAECCRVLQWDIVCCSVLQCVAVCCSVLQSVAECCSVLQHVVACCSVLQRVAVCCSALQCVAVCCSVLQCVAVCCSVLQCARRISLRKRVPCSFVCTAPSCEWHDTFICVNNSVIRVTWLIYVPKRCIFIHAWQHYNDATTESQIKKPGISMFI